MCGVPIVGYESFYSRDLIRKGGGILSNAGDPQALAQTIRQIQNREELRKLTENAVQDGRQFTEEQVFNHRSLLLKSIAVDIGH